MPQLAPRTQTGADMTGYKSPPPARMRRQRVGPERGPGPKPQARAALLSFQRPRHPYPKVLSVQTWTASKGDQQVYLATQVPCLRARPEMNLERPPRLHAL